MREGGGRERGYLGLVAMMELRRRKAHAEGLVILRRHERGRKGQGQVGGQASGRGGKVQERVRGEERGSKHVETRESEHAHTVNIRGRQTGDTQPSRHALQGRKIASCAHRVVGRHFLELLPEQMPTVLFFTTLFQWSYRGDLKEQSRGSPGRSTPVHLRYYY